MSEREKRRRKKEYCKNGFFPKKILHQMTDSTTIELSPGGSSSSKEDENCFSPLDLQSSSMKQGTFYFVCLKTHFRNVFTSEHAGRIFDRKHPDYQSSGTANIERKNGLRWRTKLRYNWYHTIMNLPALSTVAIACLVYVFINTLFTFVWLGIAQNDDPCNTGSTSFRDAFYFSLITLSTIGYGNQDLYFNGCVSPSIVIMLETLVGIFLMQPCWGTISLSLSLSPISTQILMDDSITIQYAHFQVLKRSTSWIFRMFQQTCDRANHSRSTVSEFSCRGEEKTSIG